MWTDEVKVVFHVIMCSVVELDSIFIQALGYFQSKNPGTAVTLKSLVEDSIEKSLCQKESKETPGRLQGSSAKPNKVLSKPIKPSPAGSDPRRKEKDLAQKRQFDKVQRDLDEIGQEVSKKIHKSSMSPNGVNTPLGRLNPKHNMPSNENLIQNHGSLGKVSPLAANTDDFELEMDTLACVVCRQISIGSGNQLVECQECHNLYHQDCHQPTVSDQEMNDPRCIWYCARCKRNMKKQAKQQMIKAPSISIGNSVDVLRDKTPPAEVKTPTSLTPFKRHEIKPTIPSSTGSGSMQGWASFSQKTISSNQKPSEEVSKHGDNKSEPTPGSKMASVKDKPAKAPKNHAKNATSKFTVSDVWAEALGAKASKPESKLLQKLSTSNTSLSKNNSWPSGSRTASTSEPTTQQKAAAPKAPHPNSHLPNKAAPFPKSSASMPVVSTAKNSASKNSVQNPDNAAKRLQMVKKKAAKMQQKRTRV